MSRQVKLAAYNPQWLILYEKEKRLILDAIGRIVAGIEHIGSTAVSGLAAKPVIDIMVAVNSLKDAEKCIEPLQRIGYEYVPEHETLIPERHYFRKGKPRKEQHYHLHMVKLKSEFWKRHLMFRNYLRNHPKVAQDYSNLKKKLATKYRSDREGYTEGKTSFIESVVARAKAEYSG